MSTEQELIDAVHKTGDNARACRYGYERMLVNVMIEAASEIENVRSGRQPARSEFERTTHFIRNMTHRADVIAGDWLEFERMQARHQLELDKLQGES